MKEAHAKGSLVLNLYFHLQLHLCKGWMLDAKFGYISVIADGKVCLMQNLDIFQ